MIYPATVMLAMLTDNQAFHTAAQGYLQKWLCRCFSLHPVAARPSCIPLCPFCALYTSTGKRPHAKL